MPKVSEEYLEQRKEEILDSAEKVIAQLGTSGATLDQIKAAAEVSAGALYHYFKSKDDIIAGIRDRSLASDEPAYARALDTELVKQALLELMDEGIELNHGSPDNRDARLAVMLWAEALLSPRVMETQMKLMKPWWTNSVALIERGIRQGEVNPDADPEAVSAILASISLGATVLEAWEPGRFDVDRLVAATRLLLEGGLWGAGTSSTP